MHIKLIESIERLDQGSIGSIGLTLMNPQELGLGKLEKIT